MFAFVICRQTVKAGVPGLGGLPDVAIFVQNPMAESSRTLAVFCGGMAGTVARAGVAEGIASPWCTLLVNVAGALLLGYLIVAQPTRRPLLGIGFCGGLTTFSTLQLEALELSALDAVLYLAASALLGWLAVAAGRRLA
jgi:CrcB protein